MSQPPKKVLFLITKSNWGGAQRYVYDLATALNPAEFEPVVALGGNGTLVDMLHHAGVRTISIASLTRDVSAKKDLVLGRELYRILRSERPDILHVNSSKAGGIGALIGRLARVPRIIFTAHGWAFNEDRPYWQRFIIKALHTATVLLAHHTIAVSHGMAAELNWPGVSKKMTVINPGRSIGAMFTRTEARAKIVDFFPNLLPYQDDPWLVCVAELHPIKRHEVLFTALRSLTATHPHVRLLCFGDGDLRTRLTTWVATHGMDEHIFVLGNLHEAARFLKAFDVFVLASKSESYGYVLHEAGLANVPIVATAVGGIPDIITSGETGTLVPPDNSLALSAALHEALSNTDKTVAAAKALYAQLVHRDTKAMANATAKVYTDTI
ncbi:MAG: glycosyltransferase [Candidatus Pacebacteria bacterium]|jgi:glycosyltransferase involved in cell wall biosynthesis|nr:glycosyltransferase [Candidatus Paceibacterota bacterium]